MTNGMNVATKTVLIAGANRGIGRALVDEALKRGAKRVYAAARVPVQIADERVTPLTLDVTSAAQIRVQWIRLARWTFSSTTPASPLTTI